MKIVKLKSNGTGRYEDVSPFIVTDNKLQIKVELPPVSGEFYLITENNGVTHKKLLLRNGTAEFDNLSAGEFNCEVKHYHKGSLIKVYKVEPLLLKEADGTLSAMPEIEVLNRRISSIERDFAEYRQTASRGVEELEKRLAERIQAMENNMLAVIKFAFEDYANNVYLDGGAFEDFVSKYSFTLTQEQIKTLKGEQDND